MADNRRVKLTKQMIKDAYLELLEQYPSEKISVTDICKAADVNRSTFYMYYDDTVSLRQKIENEVLEQLPGASRKPTLWFHSISFSILSNASLTISVKIKDCSVSCFCSPTANLSTIC